MSNVKKTGNMLFAVLLGLCAFALPASAAITVTNSGTAFTVTGTSSSDTILVGRDVWGWTSINASGTITDGTTAGMVCSLYSGGSGLACFHLGTPTVELRGRDGNDVLVTETDTEPGRVSFDSTVFGGNGRDTISTGGGDDVVNGNDGEVDTVDCNGGSDAFSGDSFDVTRSC